MKEKDDFLQKIEKVIQSNSQYKFEAYSFVLSALHHTVSKLNKPRHITGQELLHGIRRYAHDQFGPMARVVLNYWGINETLDFGKIVFALVDVGVLRKQPEDKLEDFAAVYDFKEVFDEGYTIEDE
ncbi:MAG TPA: Minf_1886 family protein [Verrucomicrobiae bacterium]|jgi:uncharacterized repeat protein (TIGR04138 family)|nr:Minf_1886 family protein [Verrucomicrobiae bacterium]